MQKTVRILFSLLVLVAYMVTSIGFGVHECSAKGTKHILLINSNKPCEQIHDHCSCGSDSCSTKKHSHNCCTTEIHHLEFAYDNTDTDFDIVMSCKPVTNDSPLFALNISLVESPSLSTRLDYRHGPPLYSKTNQILAALAQWRL